MTKHVTQFLDHTFLVIKAFYIFCVLYDGYLIVKDPNHYKGKDLSKAINIFLENNSLYGEYIKKLDFNSLTYLFS